MEAIAVARDWAIIILALEAIIFATVALLAAYYAQKGMGQALPRIHEFLQRAREGLAHARESVRLILRQIASPFATVHALAYAIRVFLRSLLGRDNKEIKTSCEIEQA